MISYMSRCATADWGVIKDPSPLTIQLVISLCPLAQSCKDLEIMLLLCSIQAAGRKASSMWLWRSSVNWFDYLYWSHLEVSNLCLSLPSVCRQRQLLIFWFLFIISVIMGFSNMLSNFTHLASDSTNFGSPSNANNSCRKVIFLKQILSFLVNLQADYIKIFVRGKSVLYSIRK